MAIAIQGPTMKPGTDPYGDAAEYKFTGNMVWNNAKKNENPSKDQYRYADFLLNWDPERRVSGTVEDNWIAARPDQELFTIVHGWNGPVYVLNLEAGETFPEGHSFCGNLDWSQDTRNPPLLAGNEACKD